MPRFWIWLATRPGLEDRQKQALLKHFRTPEEIYSAEDYRGVPEISEKHWESLRDRDLMEAEKILGQCHALGIKLLTYHDPMYPRRLQQIPDAPVLLYYKGELPHFDRLPTIGVVGTRKASFYGQKAARQLGGEIAACGGVVVSGMAEGIDACATEGALQAGRPVVGVLGSGADRIYPAVNRKLFQMVEHSGCLISEFPPGTLPQKWTFPKRNRLISGLSCGVVVVEAPERSGALITASRAVEQNRDVFVVPGHLDEPNCAGSNALMRQGAIVVTCGWDVVSEYEHLFPNVIEKRSFMPEKLPEPELPAAAKKVVKNAEPAVPAAPAVNIEKLASTLSADQQKLLELLQNGEQLVDDLILQSGLSSGAVLSAITMMEIRGIVRSLPGDRVAIQS